MFNKFNPPSDPVDLSTDTGGTDIPDLPLPVSPLFSDTSSDHDNLSSVPEGDSSSPEGETSAIEVETDGN